MAKANEKTKGEAKESAAKSREPLTRERVLGAAVAMADEEGLDALSMRKLGQKLGVEAMSLYNHVKNKDAILDGIVDMVVGEIEIPADAPDWKTAMRRRAAAAHDVLLRHPWSVALIESRMGLGPSRMGYFDWVIGTLRGAGFSLDLAYNAFLTMDSFIYGFTLHEVNWPFQTDEERDRVLAETMPNIPMEDYPNIHALMEHATAVSAGLDEAAAAGVSPYVAEFEFGLDLILDGLERARDGA
ncbi:MAG: TetR/AcrR family transcriptional regulator C-terminal domain-containing protein [Deltaproteobacteria bacterium]|nr:TetR/AcrR family transcriptional regulator C-terminal domain-containing protein [Deltaproteobacteria bacterium]